MIEEPTRAALARAVNALRAGELVGMPTETVYGIAADAFNPEAVGAIFRLKGRPPDNPLIVHILSADSLSEVAGSVSDDALELASEFWPGPFSMVLPRGPRVPDVVTGGLDTVAVRAPAHPVARGLIAGAGPLAAPSANPFMGLSPTRAEHIDPKVAEGLAVILQGEASAVGIESTVLSLAGPVPTLLRPGHVTVAEIEAVLGRRVSVGGEGAKRSPGLYPRHYAPRTRLELVERADRDAVALVFGAPRGALHQLLPSDPVGYAAGLYQALYEADGQGAEVIQVERPPETAEWDAVWDRLRKASYPSP